MPVIELNVSQKIDKAKKKRIADRISEDITLIPGKQQFELMSVIRDDSYIQLGDKFIENGAFINMSCFGSAEAQYNERYTLRLFEILKEELGIDGDDIYMNLTERKWWGCHGKVITG